MTSKTEQAVLTRTILDWREAQFLRYQAQLSVEDIRKVMRIPKAVVRALLRLPRVRFPPVDTTSKRYRARRDKLLARILWRHAP